MANNAKLQLIPDIAWGEFGVTREKGKIKDECGLGFEDYSDVLAEVALNTPGPFTIGVFGNWGTGKSSLMRRVMATVEREKEKVVPVWFNAWQFERDENPVVPLIATIVATLLEEKTKGKKIAEGLVKALRAVAYGLSLKANVDLKVISGEIAFSPKDMIDHLGELSDPLLDRSLFYNAFKLLNEASKNADGARVIVFIDDLDRCLLDKALMMLEYIKLVLAQPGFIFVLGLDDRVISGYLDKRFKEDFKVADFKGREYLRKLVQLSFPIPPHGKRIEIFARSCVKRIESQLSKDEQSALSDIIPIFGVACKSNPRAVIRFINNLLVDRAIAGKDENLNKIPIGMFAISRALQENWSDVFDLMQKLEDGKTLLQYLDKPPTPEELTNAEKDANRNKAVQIFRNILADDELRELLKSQPGKLYLDKDELRRSCVDFLIITRKVEEDPDLSADSNTERIVNGFHIKPRAYLKDADLSGSNLIGANLTGANLTRAYLRDANLSQANLTVAILEGAIIVGANLSRAILTGANLIDAQLLGANLQLANLGSAMLKGANLDAANLQGAFGLLPIEELKKIVHWDENTTWPDGTKG